MKYFFVFILAISSVSGKSQSTINGSKMFDIDMQVFRKGDTVWVKGDTVEFSVNTSVKFIKIGDDVYQIVKHNPTLEKVPPPVIYRGLWQGTILPNVFTNPNSMEVPIIKQ